jgi:adenosylcobinamide kinase/adenosylcobinamide-phosphate guanylyltransferase
LGFFLGVIMNPRLIFVTGGARSGKSNFAQRLAHSKKGSTVFIATAEALDDEMRQRIATHRRARPSEWDTVEEPRHLGEAVQKCAGAYDIVLVDCLTLWISNLLTNNPLPETEIVREVKSLIRSCKTESSTVIIVSNEVGMGIVPMNSLTRLYRDIVGSANQDIASEADEVYLVVSGISMKIKGDSA